MTTSDDRPIDILTDEEIAWCAANPQIAAAAAVTAAFGRDGALQTRPSDAGLMPLALALRSVRPRPPHAIKDLYVFLGMQDERDEMLLFRPAPGGVECLIGLDRQHARDIAGGLDPDSDEWLIAKFAFDRKLSDDAVRSSRSINRNGRIDEIFAVIGRPGADEMFVGVRNGNRSFPICFADCDSIATLLPCIAAARSGPAGGRVEIRRFVRTYPVERSLLKPLIG